MKNLPLLLILIIIIQACNENNLAEPLEPVDVMFGFSVLANGQNGRLALSETPDKLRITLLTVTGDTIFNHEKIGLIAFDDHFVSDPVSLIPGEYTLTSFFVLNEGDTAIYAAPVAGSSKADLVEIPLSFNFTVITDEVTNVNVEVLLVEGASPEEFGFASFNFDIIDTFFFQVAVFAVDALTGNISTTDAELSVFSNSEPVTSQSIVAGNNLIELRDENINYELLINNNSIGSFNKVFPLDSLKHYSPGTGNGPLKVVLQTVNTLTGTFTDARDGQVYRFVTIGSQTWMAENLNFGTNVATNEQDLDGQSDDLPEKTCLDSDCNEGGFYSWYEMFQTDSPVEGYDGTSNVTRRGICPEGWHIPSREEYNTLRDTVGNLFSSNASSVIAPTNDQPAGVTGGTNESGFSALKVGALLAAGSQFRFGDRAIFWTGSRTDTTGRQFSYVSYRDNGRLVNNSRGDNFFLSCRCIKD